MLEKLLLTQTRRVRLNLALLKQSTNGEKLLALAHSIPSAKFWGHDKSLSPSALTRYLSGERHPALREAIRIAEALGVDPVELIVGYAEDKRVKYPSWREELVHYCRPITGLDVPGFISQFWYVLRYIHLGYVVEGGDFRFARRSAGAEEGYCTLRFHVAKEDLPCEIALLFAMPTGHGLPIISQFGRLLLTEQAVTGIHVWTLREETTAWDAASGDFGARCWLQGPSMPFYFLGSKPFELRSPTGMLHVDKDDPKPPCVSFLPNIMHQGAF